MMFHAFSHYTPSKPDTVRRIRLALSTWEKQSCAVLPIPDPPNAFKDRLGTVPFIGALFDAAISEKAADDIIIFTNSDICCRTDCGRQIALQLQRTGAMYANRRDFGWLQYPVPDEKIHEGNLYCGTDLFAFRVFWWKLYRNDYPAMLLGREGWDAVMRTLMDLTCAGNPVFGPTDLIYHERHASLWEDAGNRYTAPSQIHNLKALKSWCKTHGINPVRFGIS